MHTLIILKICMRVKSFLNEIIGCFNLEKNNSHISPSSKFTRKTHYCKSCLRILQGRELKNTHTNTFIK